MPQMGGIEASKTMTHILKELKIEKKDRPIIIGLTGYDAQNAKQDG